MTLLVPNLPDRYEILGKLGSGGMGTVYKVHDKVLDLDVALKVLNVGTGGSDEHIVRFNKEARACAKLKHPNIIAILDFGFFNGVTPYMVLEYVEGQTLRQRISEKGALSVEEANDVFAQIARALSHAHAQKIVHRDMKPSNILITENNDAIIVKLFDFGIARVTEDADVMRLTATNAFMGTPNYMSPEQIKNEKIDARSDIYSFGCVMFEALTGELPFSSPDMMSLVELQLHSDPPKVGDVVPELKDSALEMVVDRCLRKDPTDRFQSAEEIAKHFQAKQVVDSSAETTVSHIVPQNRPWIIPVSILLLVLLIASATMLARPNRPTAKKIVKVAKKKAPSEADKIKRTKDILATTIGSQRTDEIHLANIPNFEDSDIQLIPNDRRVIAQLDVSHPRFIKSDTLLDEQLSEQGFEYVSKLTALRGIKLHEAEKVSNKSMDSLAKLPQLTDFDARNTTFEDTSSILKLKKLKYAVFSFLTPTDVAALKDLPIDTLTLASVQLDAPMYAAISSLKSLAFLSLSNCDQVDDKAILQLNSLPALHGLFIDATPSITKGDGIASLVRLKRVRLMSLKKDGLTDNDLKQLATMTSLENLLIDNNEDITGTGLMYLTKLPKLTLLDLNSCKRITKQDVKDFSSSKNAMRNKAIIRTNIDKQITNPVSSR